MTHTWTFIFKFILKNLNEESKLVSLYWNILLLVSQTEENNWCHSNSFIAKTSDLRNSLRYKQIRISVLYTDPNKAELKTVVVCSKKWRDHSRDITFEVDDQYRDVLPCPGPSIFREFVYCLFKKFVQIANSLWGTFLEIDIYI